MNISLSIDQFIPRSIYFGDPVQNTIMDNSRFIKLIYSNELVVMNGLYFEIPLKITHKATYFRRNKYFFDMNNSTVQGIIKHAQDIEYAILKKYNDNRQSIFSRSIDADCLAVKTMKPMIYDSFQHGCIKSESGTEFHSEDGQKEGGGSNTSSVSYSSSSHYGAISSHPNYHLNKQRLLRHTFDTKFDETVKNMDDTLASSTTTEDNNQCSSFTSWHVILKVSGIWENMNEFGLTYKFIITPKYSES